MGKTWNHPELGRFKYEGDGWNKQLSAPGIYSGKLPLNFEAPDSSQVPSPSAVKFSLKIRANLKVVLKKALKSLWDDLRGCGPKSGMWWHGELEEVCRDLVERGHPPITSVDDLREMLELYEISIVERVKGCSGPAATLCFGAIFEPGNTFNILTDHRAILGICYEPRPFGIDSPRKKLRRKQHNLPVWTHPELGRFKYNGVSWERPIHVPAFGVFTSDSIDPPETRLLWIDGEDATDIPSLAAMDLAQKLLANQETLVLRLIQALWDDFSGNGPSSGNWWYGKLDEVAEGLAYYGLPPIAEPGDIQWALGFAGFHIHCTGYCRKRPLLEFSFQPDFEPEHGLGVISDGMEVLGIGYSGDTSFFKKPGTGRPKATRSGKPKGKRG